MVRRVLLGLAAVAALLLGGASGAAADGDPGMTHNGSDPGMTHNGADPGMTHNGCVYRC